MEKNWWVIKPTMGVEEVGSDEWDEGVQDGEEGG